MRRKNDDLEVEVTRLMIKSGSDELKQKNPKFKEYERKIQNLVKTAEENRGRGTVVVAPSKKNILKTVDAIGEEDEEEELSNNDLFKALEADANGENEDTSDAGENLYR